MDSLNGEYRQNRMHQVLDLGEDLGMITRPAAHIVVVVDLRSEEKVLERGSRSLGLQTQ